MEYLLKKVFVHKNKLIWILTMTSILFSLGATRFELTSNQNLSNHPFYGLFLAPFGDLRYGYYVARELFLPVIAFIVFVYWLSTQKKILRFTKENLRYFFLIGFLLVTSRILTYGFWFYNDDIRFFHWQYAAPTLPNFNPNSFWGPVGLHPIAIFLIVLNWFGTNYTLYNSLGLFFFFLAGVTIFVLVNKIQNNKFISLVAALFLLTTPTYFQGRLLIGEIINSPFILILVILSFYMLLQRFFPGALIFTAAALEYGIAKSYFIALPLTLFALFFPVSWSFRERIKKNWLFILYVLSISAVYKPAFFAAPSYQNLSLTSAMQLYNLDRLFVLGDVLMSVSLSYIFSYPLVHLLSLIFNGWIYITATLGFLIIGSFAIVSFISYFKNKKLSAKLILLCLSIVVPTALVASFMGVRVDHNVQKLVLYSNNGNVPSGATGYGIFPALGLTLAFVALGYILKKRTFRVLAIILILLNIIGSIVADYRWLKSAYSFPQRRYNEQLQQILPKDTAKKYVFVPGRHRPLFEGIRAFSNVLRADQGVLVFMGSDDFVDALKKDNVNSKDIFYLISSGMPKYDISDYSDRVRGVPYERLAPTIESLTAEVAPKHVDY